MCMMNIDGGPFLQVEIVDGFKRGGGGGGLWYSLKEEVLKYLRRILLNSCQTFILFAKENSTKTSYEDTQNLLSSS